MAAYLEALLDINRFRDYCPNGLQVEGRREIRKIVSGVTASLALVEAAIEEQADAIIVHHGYFWKGEDARVIGAKHKRLKALLSHDINLFGFHLPLDDHPELGNNAQLAHKLGLEPEGRFGEDGIGWIGRAPALDNVETLSKVIEHALGRRPLVIGDAHLPVGRIAWCTGAAQGFIGDAISAGANIYISGEISEQTVHIAREAGVVYLSCGHHATERYGIQALGTHLAQHFGLEHCFIDIDNPV